MSDKIKTTKISTAQELIDFLLGDDISGSERIETISWWYEQDYENMNISLEYGEEDLFVTLHNHRLRVIVGESARKQYIGNMEELAKREQQQKEQEAKVRQQAIKDARATLARYGVGLIDDDEPSK